MPSPSSESFRAEAEQALWQVMVDYADDRESNPYPDAVDAVFAVLQKHIEALPTCVRDLWTDERGVTFSHLTVDLPDLLALFGQEHASETEETP
jgi:uncharacterized protein (DUF2267 family)